MEEYMSVLPPPYPPLPVRVWKDTYARMRCPFCRTIFTVKKGTVKCPKCGISYIVGEWDLNSFLIGVAVGLIIGFIITVGVYYVVLRPYIPLVRLGVTLREIFKA